MAQLLSALSGRRSSFASFNYNLSRHNFLVTVQKIGYEQWLASGCDGPGHPARGASNEGVF